MRKGIAEGKAATDEFTLAALSALEKDGYKFVQVKGFTMDNHYDYVEPHSLVLFPMRELPAEQAGKDIYEPIDSKILQQWAAEKNEDGFEFRIAAV